MGASNKSDTPAALALMLAVVAALALANSPLGPAYQAWLAHDLTVGITPLALTKSVLHWINDGLMAIFFLLIGLEIERELYVGELSNLKNASLPIVAAIGGMATPALIHFLINRGTETQGGIGIPMATDIAFALGVLALLGNKIPASLKVFLTALAIIDDLGAIIIIALFYVGDLSLPNLLLSFAVFAGLLILNRLGVRRLPFYLIPGIFMWYFMFQSGIHAAVAGVLLAFAIPFRKGNERSPSYQLQHFLHRPVAFVIMPLFALANTGITLTGRWAAELMTTNSIGVFLGLFVGKPLGIFTSGFLAVKTGLSQLPGDLSWKHILGAGFLGGIGFTMSIFITLLAFSDPLTIQSTKISILLGSLFAGFIGYFVLRNTQRE